MGALKRLFKNSTDPTQLQDEERWFEDAPAYQRPDLDTKIRMIQTVRGTVNGFTVQTFTKGESYEVTQSLAEALIGSSVAERI
jgi:hypothetical protein